MASHTHTDLQSHISLIQQNPKPTAVDLVGGIYCHICHLRYGKKKDFDNHYIEHNSNSKEIIYTCVVCCKEMKSYPSFRGHCYTMHVIKDRHKCEHCSKLFSKLTSLKEHIKTVHTFKCSTCSKQFTSKTELRLHHIIHNSDSPPYHCQVCEQEIDSVEGCKDHIDLHTVSIYFCPICHENISDRQNASQHLKMHFDNDDNESEAKVVQNSNDNETVAEQSTGILCSFCYITCSNRVEFDAHFSSEHGDKDIVYTCACCDKQFEKYSVFSQHAYNHITKGRFCCNICLKSFNRVSTLASHMVACQADSESSGKPFACFECGHRYGTETSLRRHLQDVHGIHCITCPVENCQKRFASPKELIFHQYVHRSEKNWCRQCGLLFISLSSCERHLEVHRKKLYGCPICTRNYGEKNLLFKHVVQHFESVLHVCKVCGKVYNHKNRFMEHMKTHSKNKSYNCTYCSKGFVKLGHLQQHLNIHTGSKPYKCTICLKTFSSYPNWYKHKRRMHKFENVAYKNNVHDALGVDEESLDSTETIDNTESFDTIEPTDNVETLDKEYLHNDAVKIDQFGLNSVTSLDKQDEILTDVKVQVQTLDLKSFTFPTSEDSTMESESIDTIEIERELHILENATANTTIENIGLVDVLSTNAAIFGNGEARSSSTAHCSLAPTFPAEYGPEFSAEYGLLDLDDHMLPHIDPLLTIKTGPCPPDLALASPAKWEPPVFTKVYSDYSFGYGDVVDASRLSMMNTDIF